MEQRQSYKSEEQVSSYNKSAMTSPLSAAKLVAKVNSLATAPSAPRRSFLNANVSVPQKINVDYKTMVDKLSEITASSDANAFYLAVHKVLTQFLNCSFTAFGLFNETSKCINLKLIDKTENVYSSKIFGADSENPVSQCFYTRKIIVKDNVDFLNIAYFRGHKVSIIPMISVNKCIGVMLIADRHVDPSEKLYNFIANYVVAFVMERIEKALKRAKNTLTPTL